MTSSLAADLAALLVERQAACEYNDDECDRRAVHLVTVTCCCGAARVVPWCALHWDGLTAARAADPLTIVLSCPSCRHGCVTASFTAQPLQVVS